MSTLKSLCHRLDIYGIYPFIEDRLVEHYANRPYHNLRHISFMDKSTDPEIVEDLDSFELAVFFHDIVYDTKSNHNEEDSALVLDFIMRGLISDKTLNKAKELILDTKHISTPSSNDGKYLCDLDMLGLSFPYGTFKENNDLIDSEYNILGEDFIRGRVKFFKGLLEKPQIFYTKPLFKVEEELARNNILRYIDSTLSLGIK
jgi:predicted metal-dependent HD superfamily phosphohydrolase